MKYTLLGRVRLMAACATMSIASLSAACTQSADETTATATAEVCGDGMKVTTVVFAYPQPIDGTRIDTATYQVVGRQIVDAYTSTDAEGHERSESGRYVTLCLDKTIATTGGMGGGMRRPGGSGVGGPQGDERHDGQPQGRPTGGAHQAGRLFNDSPEARQPHYNDSVTITRVATLYTVGGDAIAPTDEPLTIKSTSTLVADDFQQYPYTDAETGVSLPYNLFTPKHIEEGKLYPLVLFMHDASGAGKSNVRHALLQGNGATVWATDEWQAEHPCFVLAPQFGTVTMDDDFNYTPDLTACLNLLDSLVAALPVDAHRIYTTGQSMGCMMSYEFLYRRPDLFASALLVAGQWDPDKMAPLAKKNLFIVSCTGDDRSSAGVAQAKEIWTANGGVVVEQEWPLEASTDERTRMTEQLLAQGGNIHYAHLQGGFHNLTWRLAYDFKAVREWLFGQSNAKDAEGE